MMIGTNEMEIQEIESSLKLQTNVLYFTITDEDFPALIRKTTFKNLDDREKLHLDVLDGLGRLIPAGLGNWALDAMGRTMEAWMNVSIRLVIFFLDIVVLEKDIVFVVLEEDIVVVLDEDIVVVVLDEDIVVDLDTVFWFVDYNEYFVDFYNKVYIV
jgi:hypothetical protein